MRRGHVSESFGGRHPNARSGAQKLSGADSPVTQGQYAGRSHEHGTRPNTGLVMDSPPYVDPNIHRCIAIRRDGEKCINEVKAEGGYCFGHGSGRGAL